MGCMFRREKGFQEGGGLFTEGAVASLADAVGLRDVFELDNDVAHY